MYNPTYAGYYAPVSYVKVSCPEDKNYNEKLQQSRAEDMTETYHQRIYVLLWIANGLGIIVHKINRTHFSILEPKSKTYLYYYVKRAYFPSKLGTVRDKGI
jgi:hypothetical protein